MLSYFFHVIFELDLLHSHINKATPPPVSRATPPTLGKATSPLVSGATCPLVRLSQRIFVLVAVLTGAAVPASAA